MLILDGELKMVTMLDGEMSANIVLDGEATIVTEYSNYDEYTGVVDVTPSDVEQTLATNGLLMRSNITIQPIPSNYGLITWNGRGILVS